MPNNDESQFYLATITEVTNDGAKMQIDGHDEALKKEYKQINTGAAISQGDRVLAIKISGTYVILGAIGHGSSQQNNS